MIFRYKKEAEEHEKNNNIKTEAVEDGSDMIPSVSAQIRRRGRPCGRTVPCLCPNCQLGINSDRHICHFVNCGKTFTKKTHLEAHLRGHMGNRPFQCPQPGCDADFIR